MNLNKFNVSSDADRMIDEVVSSIEGHAWPIFLTEFVF